MQKKRFAPQDDISGATFPHGWWSQWGSPLCCRILGSLETRVSRSDFALMLTWPVGGSHGVCTVRLFRGENRSPTYLVGIFIIKIELNRPKPMSGQLNRQENHSDEKTRDFMILTPLTPIIAPLTEPKLKNTYSTDESG